MDWKLPRLHSSASVGSHPGSTVGSTISSSEPAPRGEVFSLLSFELKRYSQSGSKITAEVESKVVNRCVLAALEVLAREEAGVSLAGTAMRPIVQARFEGSDSPSRAARAALSVLDAVRRVQRSRENEFRVVGSLACGTALSDNGVLVETGSTDRLLQRLRDRAAPGQILLSPDARESCLDQVEVIPAGGVTRSAPDAYVLLGLR
jgi:hypothetical protein